jgi:DNA modification methylase
MRKWAAEGVKAQTCVTSPPYFGLRDYGHEGQIGLEQTPEEYIAAMVEVFRCVWDVLSDDGTVWLNIGDSYYNYRPGKGQSLVKQSVASNNQDLPQTCARRGNKLTGLKEKDLIGIPWMLAFALRADGWYLRQDIIWHKPNPMPESVRDRCTKAHEYIFLLSKSEKYFFDNEALKEPATNAGKKISLGAKSFSKGQAAGSGISASGNGLSDFYDVPEKRNRRSVWTVTTRPYKGAHFATFPTSLIEPCVLAGSRPNDIVLDPFMGSGTTAQVALQHGRQYLGCELNDNYAELQQERINSILQIDDKQIDMFDYA